jgi:Ca2+-binding EF-hand superfamily protein
MTDLRLTVTETVHRRYGQIIEIIYEYDEIKQAQFEENMQIKQEKRARSYQASIKRDEYERIANRIQYQRDVLSFDTFVNILRPLMMGTYEAKEIRQAFRLLDTNSSNTIDLNKLSAFVSVIHPNMSKGILLNYIRKVKNNGDERINFDEFNQMVLRGIGRDIVCGHV